MRFRSLWSSTLDLIFPRNCEGCQQTLMGELNPCFCDHCWGTIRLLEGPGCPSCGRPFASKFSLTHSPGHRCGECRRRPPRFDHALAVGSYDGILADSIRLFKYHGKTSLARPLGELLFRELGALSSVDCLVPVPLHPKRLREREYNQALLLCDVVGKQTDIEVLPHSLERSRETAPQKGLNLLNRRRNVRRAFTVKRPSDIKDREVLLVDDVLTTGATVNECARMLKHAGAKTVTVLTLARVLAS